MWTLRPPEEAGSAALEPEAAAHQAKAAARTAALAAERVAVAALTVEPTPSLLAHILSDKFCDGLPFHRQEC
ncbi:hypothetical protein WME89_53125 [Sorangium sp. So ce321]|uniref:hypothetical protein n=1 Tax=Sorangium sp. So ce321 TaxID=3133300 RepID=UPI003F630F07